MGTLWRTRSHHRKERRPARTRYARLQTLCSPPMDSKTGYWIEKHTTETTESNPQAQHKKTWHYAIIST